MIRRMQLLGPQDQLHSNRLAAVGERIREGLLRDNKVVPVVLATLALLIFAWLVAGAFVGNDSDEEVANQASLAQNEEEPDSGDAESPAPGVENRDTDSYSAFESKDPFRELLSKDGEDKAGESKAGGSKNGDSKSGDSKAGGTRAGSGKAGDNNGGGARDNKGSIGQPPPGDPDFRGSQGGSGGLFSSGGDLPSP